MSLSVRGGGRQRRVVVMVSACAWFLHPLRERRKRNSQMAASSTCRSTAPLPHLKGTDVARLHGTCARSGCPPGSGWRYLANAALLVTVSLAPCLTTRLRKWVGSRGVFVAWAPPFPPALTARPSCDRPRGLWHRRWALCPPYTVTLCRRVSAFPRRTLALVPCGDRRSRACCSVLWIPPEQT